MHKGHRESRRWIGYEYCSCDLRTDTVDDALARTISLSVDARAVDSQRLCPGWFADWIDRYQQTMQAEPVPTVGVDVVVD